MKRILNKTAQNKKIFLRALKDNLNNVSAAVEISGVSRTQFYTWRREDPDFREKVDEVPEFQIDFVENALMKRINDGSDTAITFFLKTKGRKRGFGDNIEVTGDLNIKITYEDEEKPNLDI